MPFFTFYSIEKKESPKSRVNKELGSPDLKESAGTRLTYLLQRNSDTSATLKPIYPFRGARSISGGSSLSFRLLVPLVL